MTNCFERGCGYKYLGILEADGVKHREMKQQTRKEYIRRISDIFSSKVNVKNITAINFRALSVIRYGVEIIGRTCVNNVWSTSTKTNVDSLYKKRAK